MTMLGLRAAVISKIDSSITAFQTVQGHGGKFDKKELLRIATKSPAALVTVLGGPVERESGQGAADLTVVIFIVTRGDASTQRDSAVLILAEAVAGLAVGNEWGYADAQAPLGIRMDNLYSGEIDRTGVALWSVSWTTGR